MVNPVVESLPKGSIGSTEETLIRVLHVDDDAGYLKTAKKILEMQGSFQVETVLSVEEAMEKMEKKTFDVIVSDYIMPGKDGLEFLKELRDSGNSIPFIIFTGKGREIVAIKALNLGANQYINKIGKPEAVYSELAHGIRTVVKGKKAEEMLEKEQQELNRIVDSSPIIIFYKDNEGKFLRVNKAHAEALKISKEEFLGKTVFDLYSSKIAQSMTKDDSEVLESGRPKLGIIEQYESASGIRWVQTSKVPIFNENGSVTGLVGFAQDITEGKKMEKALQLSEGKYRRMVEQAPDSIITFDLNGVVTSCNPASVAISGYSKDGVIGKHFSELRSLSKKEIQKFLKLLPSFLDGKVPEPFEIAYLNENGTSAFGEVHISLMKEGERITGFQAIMRDVTEHKKAEEALRDSEKSWSDSFNSLEDVIILVNKDYTIEKINDSGLKLLGKTREEVVGKKCYRLIHGMDAAGDFCPFKRALKTGKAESVERYEELFDKYFSIKSSPIFNERGETLGFVDLMRDITERKRVEAELKREKELMEMVTANNAAALVIISKDFRILWANKFLTEYLGDIRGKVCYSTLNNLTNVCPGCGVKEILETGKNKVVHKQVVPGLNGKKVWLEITAIPIRDKNGNIIAVSEMSIDITDRKRAEEALRESEEKYRELLNGMNDTAWVIDFDCNIIDVNDAAVEVMGYSREELLSMELTGIDSNLDPEEIKGLVEGMPAAEIQVFETVHTTKDGKRIPVEISSSLVTYRGKHAILSIARNITERKRAEKKLRQSEEKYRTVFKNTGTAMCILEEDKTISMVNRRFEELSGYSWKELEGKKWTELVTKEYLERMKRYHEARRKRGGKAPAHYSFDFVNKKGQIRNCLLTVNLIPETKKSVASILDITESKKTKKALREAEEKYRETIVNANVGIIGYGPEGEVKVLNPKMEQMTGFKRSEIPTLQDWFKKLYPNKEERHKIRDKWFKRMSEECEVKEGHGIITTKDGKRRNFLFNAVRLESGDSIAFADDITERKEAEEKLDGMMNELVTINEKLGVVGRLTRHDARNKLSVIANNVYLAKQKLATNHSSLEYLGDIESAVDQMEEIFDFARTYEMLGVEELSYMNVEKSVDEATMLFSGLDGAKLVNEFQGLTVLADSLLRQLFYNLIDDTLKHGETVSQIRVYYKEVGEDQLKLVYEDDGVGIPEDEKEKIFGEGYGKGTGYGLYLIKKICEAYGWTIQETGKPGKGAQFTMTMPKTNLKGKIAYQLQ